MASLQERMALLERDLADPKKRLSDQMMVPMAVFLYEPRDEYVLRREKELLAIRLRNSGKHIVEVDLCELLWSMITEVFPKEEFFQAERSQGLQPVLETIINILGGTGERPSLEERIAQLVGELPADSGVVLLWRLGALYPVYNASHLLARLQGKVKLPVVLFYPGTQEDRTTLRFMGKWAPGGSYRERIY
jgi:hypothetical protein